MNNMTKTQACSNAGAYEKYEMEAAFAPPPSDQQPITELFLDDVINAVGFGRWTTTFFLVATLVPMTMVGNLFVAEFTVPSLNFTCASDSPNTYDVHDNSYDYVVNVHRENIIFKRDVSGNLYDRNNSTNNKYDSYPVINETKVINSSLKDREYIYYDNETDEGESDIENFVGVKIENGVDESRGGFRIIGNGRMHYRFYSYGGKQDGGPGGNQDGGEDSDPRDYYYQQGTFRENVDGSDSQLEFEAECYGPATVTQSWDKRAAVTQSWDGSTVSGGRKLCTRYSYYGQDATGGTVTEEYSLVCRRAWLRPLFQLLFTLGCMGGAAVGGVLADWYGRQRMVWWGCVACAACTALHVALPLLPILLVTRCLLGVFIFVAVNPLTNLALEVCPTHLRHTFGPFESLPYALAMPLLAVVAYFVKDWRAVQVWLTVPILITLCIANPWVLHESPRWLVSQGKVSEATVVLRRAARLHGTTHHLPPHLYQLLDGMHKKQHRRSTPDRSSLCLRESLWSLVSTTEMRTITMATMTMWFIEGALYISLPLQTSTYQSPYVYLSILGLLEVPGSLIVTPLGERLGRRGSCWVLSLVAAAALVAVALLRAAGSSDESLLCALSVVAYTAMVGVTQMITLLTSEVFPTTVRSLGASLGYFMNNVGNCLPPVLDLLMPQAPAHVPMLLFGFLAAANAMLVMLIPETRGRRLYETVHEHVQDQRARDRAR